MSQKKIKPIKDTAQSWVTRDRAVAFVALLFRVHEGLLFPAPAPAGVGQVTCYSHRNLDRLLLPWEKHRAKFSEEDSNGARLSSPLTGRNIFSHCYSQTSSERIICSRLAPSSQGCRLTNHRTECPSRGNIRLREVYHCVSKYIT